MSKALFISCMLCFLLVCCNSDNSSVATEQTSTVNIQNESPNTTTLKVEAPLDEHVYAYYFDEFGDIIRINLQKDSATGKIQDLHLPIAYPIRLVFTKGFGLYPVYLFPGETVTVRSYPMAPTKYVFEGERSEELNFFTLLEKKACGVGYVDSFGMEMRTNLDRKGRRFYDLYSKRMELLQTVGDSLGFSAAFLELCRLEFLGQYLYAMSSPYYMKGLDFDSVPKSYTDSLDNVLKKGWLQDSELARSSYFYQLGIGDYVHYMARAAKGTDLELETRYSHTSEKLTGRLRDIALFQLIKTNLDKGVPGFQA